MPSAMSNHSDMDHAEHSYVLIIAGGAGTRLWPISRKSRPKQFQAFTNGQTLLQNMASLATQVVPIERVFVMATTEFSPVIREQLPDLPQENLLFEPARRDTGPAAALAMLQIHQRDPEATVAMLWSDHVIQDAEGFSKVLSTCFQAVSDHPEALVSVGANPTYPDTGLGYIQMGDIVHRYGDVTVFQVRKFVEKPDLATAKKFLSSWEYLWNVGYNVMRAGYFMGELRRVQPELTPILDELEAAKDPAAITAAFEKLPKISLDYLLVQKLTTQLVVPADIGWSDIGNWNTLHDVLRGDKEDGMVTRGEVYSVESENNLVFAKDRPIALVGVKGLIVVDEGDSLLVMHKESAQSLKKLIATLEEHNESLL